ncbi:MAG: pyrimidine-nucleoside phosphorylase, partial [Ammonifex sp.]
GAGRTRKDEEVDPAVGVLLAAKVGTRVEAGEPLAYVLARDKGLEEAMRLVANAYTIASVAPSPRPMVHAVIYEGR